MTVSVALVEPLYHVNAGHVARLMKNFGAAGLFLVNPHFNSEEAIKFSTHGKRILASAKVVTFDELRAKFDVLAGTTAITATSRLNVLRGQTRPEELAKLVQSVGKSKSFCIVLGRESSGLNNTELQMCDFVVTIDTKTKYRTLNISHALSILLYEISGKISQG
jgi:TrmH family RNA methyltransferase